MIVWAGGRRRHCHLHEVAQERLRPRNSFRLPYGAPGALEKEEKRKQRVVHIICICVSRIRSRSSAQKQRQSLELHADDFVHQSLPPPNPHLLRLPSLHPADSSSSPTSSLLPPPPFLRVTTQSIAIRLSNRDPFFERPSPTRHDASNCASPSPHLAPAPSVESASGKPLPPRRHCPTLNCAPHSQDFVFDWDTHLSNRRIVVLSKPPRWPGSPVHRHSDRPNCPLPEEWTLGSTSHHESNRTLHDDALGCLHHAAISPLPDSSPRRGQRLSAFVTTVRRSAHTEPSAPTPPVDSAVVLRLPRLHASPPLRSNVPVRSRPPSIHCKPRATEVFVITRVDQAQAC